MTTIERPPAKSDLLGGPAKPTTTEPATAEGVGGLSGRLNWLRAGVLGAGDGIVSTAALVLGVAGATGDRTTIVIAGLVGALAGALSMASGEYVSVSTQRDSERAVLVNQRRALIRHPAAELRKLAAVYREQGIDEKLAAEVAEQLTGHDALAAHVTARYGIDPTRLTNPWHAAAASFVAFTLGALVPLLAVAFGTSVWLTVALVAVALGVTGAISARLGNAPALRATIRNIGGGLVAMAVTYGLGSLVGLAG